MRSRTSGVPSRVSLVDLDPLLTIKYVDLGKVDRFRLCLLSGYIIDMQLLWWSCS
jgi:hypothetical protein